VIINTLALLQALHLSGSTTFSLQFCSIIQAKFTTISKKIDLSSIPEKYHEYANVFSKSKAETLASYCPYNLWINLEKDSHSPVGTIYSLFKFKQEALKEFIDENLTNGFIRSTSSPHRAPVLFVKKKDRSLWLCVDFCCYAADGDQREFDLETRVTTNGNLIIPEMFYSCALNK